MFWFQIKQFFACNAFGICLRYHINYMREIIQIQVGQCGNMVGAQFWQTIALQHSIDSLGYYYGESDQQLEKINTYFQESEKGGFIPRVIFTDTDPNILNNIKKSQFGKFFPINNYLYGRSKSGNNWAKGYYTEGADLLDGCLEMIQRSMQKCDSPVGFQMIHGLGGGTGSGMGSLVLCKLKEQYFSKHIETFSIFPSHQTSNNNDPYSSVLTLNYLINQADDCMVFDNQTLCKICFNNYKKVCPNFSDLNYMISPTIASITSSLRFPMRSFSTIKERIQAFVPFPKLHFFMVGRAPLIDRNDTKVHSLSLREITNRIFKRQSILCQADPSNGRYLAAEVIFKGKVSTHEVEFAVRNQQINNRLSFVEWMPERILSSIYTPVTKLSTSVISIINSTSIEQQFKRFAQQFDSNLRKRVFFHNYKGQGMDEYEFLEAREAVTTLRGEYRYYYDDQDI